MPYIVIRPLVIHLVGIACTTELQKLEHLIYMETGAQRIFAGHIHVIVDRKTSTLQGEEKTYPLRREHRTKEGGTYLREKICSV